MKEQEETLRKAISYCIELYDNKEATNRIMQFIKDDRSLHLLLTVHGYTSVVAKET